MVVSLCLSPFLAGSSSGEQLQPAVKDVSQPGPALGQTWRAIIFAPAAKAIDRQGYVPGFKRLVEEALAPMGVNMVFFDMHWKSFRYSCRPELAKLKLDAIKDFSREEARQMAGICRDNGIRVVVGMNFLTHQNYGTLLAAYPMLQWPGSKRLWDPLNPKVNEIAFAMADELLDAFQADGFHVGLDEAFDLDVSTHPKALEQGYTAATLLAKCIKDYHEHLVKKCGVEMFMWTDTLEDRFVKPLGTKPAIDLIPKDITLCYWYYYVVKDPPNYTYPWPRTFIKKGFRVLACPWKHLDGTNALIDQMLTIDSPRMVGVLFTTWSGHVVPELRPALLEEGDVTKLDETIQGVAESIGATLPKLGKRDSQRAR